MPALHWPPQKHRYQLLGAAVREVAWRVPAFGGVFAALLTEIDALRCAQVT